MIDSKI